MNVKLSKLMLMHFLIFTTFVLGFIGYGAYYSWSMGASDFNRISSIYKANTFFDELAKGEEIKSIRSDVTSDGIRKAFKKMENLYKKVEKVNLQVDSEEFENFTKSFEVAKSEMLKLVSYPEVSSIIGVLNRKISDFNNFVSENNWRTLTRMSKRLKAKTSSAAQDSPQFYHYKKLSYTYKFIRTYETKMKAITLGSILSPLNKNQVVEKIDSFDTEMKMLDGFLNSYGTLTNSISAFEKSYHKWIANVRPELAEMRLNVESTSRSFYLGIGVFAAFVFLFGLIGIKVHNESVKANMRVLEDNMLRIVRDGLIPFRSKTKIVGTQKFQDELERYKDYFHKRMSFGAIFQEAVPFPAILLDSNLNLVWANKLFYEDWKVKNVNDSENIVTWDYLQKFTNLGEDDPVFSAINQGLAGIYQIQLKLEDSKESIPYEMYVTPVSYLEQKRVMIFFYPLRSLEETITHQRKSMIGPVMRTLDALMCNSFNENFIERIETDYEAAGMPQVFEKFISYNQKHETDKEVLVNEIEMLNSNLMKSEEAFENLSKKIESIATSQSGQRESFSTLKNSLIEIVGIKHNLRTIFSDVIENMSFILDSKDKLVKDVDSLNHILSETKKVISAINDDKEKIKKFKIDLEDLKFSLKKKCAYLDRSSGQSLMKDIFPEIDITLDKFVKTIGHLDITMSKANMIMGEGRAPELKPLLDAMSNLQVKHEQNISSVNSFFESIQVQEDQMVESLKKSFDGYKNVKEDVGQIGHIISTQMIAGNNDITHLEIDI